MNSLPPPPSPGISAVNHDILRSHILTRLDGPSLASTSCASPELHELAADDHLWQQLCASTWPSISDPLVSAAISTFPSGHRSFFSHSYPLIHHHRHSPASASLASPETTEFISAVDIYYQNSPIFSKVERTATATGWFNTSPFRVDLLGPKEFIPTWVQNAGEEDLRIRQLEENVTLSWILIDPNTKRAVNLSSQRAVAAERHWLTGEVQVKFAVVMAGGAEPEKEHVMCEVVVTCGGEGGEEVHVREVSMMMEDLEGRVMNGKDSLVILREAMERGERRKMRGEGKESKGKYLEFLERKRKRKEKMQRIEKVLDWVCIATGVNCVLAFWSYMIFG